MSAPAPACQPALRNKFGHRFPIKGGWRGLLVSGVKVAVGRAEQTRVYNGCDTASLMGVFIQLGMGERGTISPPVAHGDQ